VRVRGLGEHFLRAENGNAVAPPDKAQVRAVAPPLRRRPALGRKPYAARNRLFMRMALVFLAEPWRGVRPSALKLSLPPPNGWGKSPTSKSCVFNFEQWEIPSARAAFVAETRIPLPCCGRERPAHLCRVRTLQGVPRCAGRAALQELVRGRGFFSPGRQEGHNPVDWSQAPGLTCPPLREFQPPPRVVLAAAGGKLRVGDEQYIALAVEMMDLEPPPLRTAYSQANLHRAAIAVAGEDALPCLSTFASSLSARAWDGG
jgi:hypothetical protein